ncbi:hypothetical protein [Burkholderia sp. 22PA0106]|uniref:hypothetical protein n=1 Tax=Burkholderia sp. 22PA0106 TaxID=3237371 RepID=UPI0039C4829A
MKPETSKSRRSAGREEVKQLQQKKAGNLLNDLLRGQVLPRYVFVELLTIDVELPTKFGNRIECGGQVTQVGCHMMEILFAVHF